jgi:hypothetical protein
MLECTGLRPSPEQQERGYVADNVFSLAQAYVEPWWTPLAVYVDETMVGFVMYGRWPESGFSEIWQGSVGGADRPDQGTRGLPGH